MAKQSTTACYLRVSKLDQQKGMDSQQRAIESYLDNHGIEIVSWYRDKLSGKDLKRPQFERMQKAIFSGQIRTVIVWKLDRLSRSQKDGINLLANWMEQGIRVIAVAQQIDLSSSTGRLISSLLFGLAKLERENLREATRRGLAAARAKGIKLGRRPVLEKQQVSPLVKQGMSLNSIAKHLKCSRTAVRTCIAKHDLKPTKRGDKTS